MNLQFANKPDAGCGEKQRKRTTNAAWVNIAGAVFGDVETAFYLALGETQVKEMCTARDKSTHKWWNNKLASVANSKKRKAAAETSLESGSNAAIAATQAPKKASADAAWRRFGRCDRTELASAVPGSLCISCRRRACCVLPRGAFVGAWLTATGRNASILSAQNLPAQSQSPVRAWVPTARTRTTYAWPGAGGAALT